MSYPFNKRVRIFSYWPFVYSAIVFVKKTFRYGTVFFYNHLYHPSVCRNVFLKSGIIGKGESNPSWIASLARQMCTGSNFIDRFWVRIRLLCF
jgi:hypothetical protein